VASGYPGIARIARMKVEQFNDLGEALTTGKVGSLPCFDAFDHVNPLPEDYGSPFFTLLHSEPWTLYYAPVLDDRMQYVGISGALRPV
jgi:hypothetical protein